MIYTQQINLYNAEWEVTFWYTPALESTDVSPPEPECYEVYTAMSFHDGIGQWKFENKHLDVMPQLERDIIKALKQSRKENYDYF